MGASGLMDSVLDSGSSVSPGFVWVSVLSHSWASHLTLTVSLSTQEYMYVHHWVPGIVRATSVKIMLGGYLRWTCIFPLRGVELLRLSCFMLWKP